VDVEKDEAIAFRDARAVDAAHVAANLSGHADRHVTRNDRIRHAAQPPVPHVNVGAAHFGEERAEQDGPRLQRRLGELTQLDRHAWCRFITQLRW
jgi:hypothetical protein